MTAFARFRNGIDLLGSTLKSFLLERLTIAPDPAITDLYVDTTGTNKRIMFHNGTTWIDLGAVPNTGFTPKGNIDATTNPAFPASPNNGDVWLITGDGTVGGETVEDGELLYYVGGQFIISQTNLVQATETQVGFLRFSTLAETLAGVLNSVAVSPANLAAKLTPYARKFPYQITADGVLTDFTIPHNLATADVSVSVREESTKEKAYVVDKLDSVDPTNKVVISFGAPPANGIKFDVVVIG